MSFPQKQNPDARGQSERGIKMAASKLRTGVFSVCTQRDANMCRISEVFYEISPTLWHKGNSVTGDLRFVSFEALREDVRSLISRKTGVELKSIEVQRIVFYKNGKQARVKEIRNTLECYLAPSEYPLESTGEDTEAEHRNPVKIGVLWRDGSTTTPMAMPAMGVQSSESASASGSEDFQAETISPRQWKNLGLSMGRNILVIRTQSYSFMHYVGKGGAKLVWSLTLVRPQAGHCTILSACQK